MKCISSMHLFYKQRTLALCILLKPHLKSFGAYQRFSNKFNYLYCEIFIFNVDMQVTNRLGAHRKTLSCVQKIN